MERNEIWIAIKGYAILIDELNCDIILMVI